MKNITFWWTIISAIQSQRYFKLQECSYFGYQGEVGQVGPRERMAPNSQRSSGSNWDPGPPGQAGEKVSEQL